ncbi:hypothetical protein BOVATA_039710 [Babesia ovata]|uniref:Uncharacterized protein n=1 Tax=Babesia ovata TaxID=189622 RepID=A0A2H6KHL0_9APIC|nr:uncharacterized protein BOVATA_039710 [Babesia ovata]GBE62478.1 hypothetical protein BOVATA_039710 [Babesia ovata]
MSAHPSPGFTILLNSEPTAGSSASTFLLGLLLCFFDGLLTAVSASSLSWLPTMLEPTDSVGSSDKLISADVDFNEPWLQLSPPPTEASSVASETVPRRLFGDSVVTSQPRMFSPPLSEVPTSRGGTLCSAAIGDVGVLRAGFGRTAKNFLRTWSQLEMHTYVIFIGPDIAVERVRLKHLDE